MSVSLSQIMEMPHAAILAERIQSALKEEKKERNRFYQMIDEEKKVELQRTAQSKASFCPISRYKFAPFSMKK